MIDKDFKFPLSIQLLLPRDYAKDAEFAATLQVLSDHSFSGLELNIVDPEEVDPKDLADFLGEFGIGLTMFASGAAARAHELSLSHPDDSVRSASVDRCLGYLDFAEAMGIGVIAGLIQGAATSDVAGARQRFADSLTRIEQNLRGRSVPFLVEGTNRYLTSVANRLDDAVALISGFDNENLRILPDTFHMNIEEADMLAALSEHRARFDSIHFSDNNRYFPGLGAIDFNEIVRFLEGIGYAGGIALEAEIKTSLTDDLQASMGYLSPILLG